MNLLYSRVLVRVEFQLEKLYTLPPTLFSTVVCSKIEVRGEGGISTQIERPRSPRLGGLRRSSWVFWKAGDALRTQMAFLSEKRFWEKILNKNEKYKT